MLSQVCHKEATCATLEGSPNSNWPVQLCVSVLSCEVGRSLYLSCLNAAGISPAGASLLDDSDDNHEGQISREEREILPPRPLTAFKVKRIMQKCTCFKYPLTYKMCAV